MGRICWERSWWNRGWEDTARKGDPSRRRARPRGKGPCLRPLRMSRAVCQSWQVSSHSWVLAPRSHMEEQLEDLMGQHKDLWEFQVSHHHCLQPKPLLSRVSAGCSGPSAPAQLHGKILDSVLLFTHPPNPSALPLIWPPLTTPPLPHVAKTVTVTIADLECAYLAVANGNPEKAMVRLFLHSTNVPART